MLAIEIDGRSHEYKISADIKRQQKLESLGIRFLRFTEHDVRINIDRVVSSIETWIEKNE
jgi:very-short-patch-repair endonuclease